MLKIIERFDKHCSCHLHGECDVGQFWKLYIGHAACGELDLMLLICGEEERGVIQWEKGMGLRKGVLITFKFFV
jgi:hypothetical protein